MKDAAQDVARDVTQDVAEDRSVREGAHCGTCRLLAVEPTPNTRMPTPTPALGRHVKDGHVKDAGESAILIKQNCAVTPLLCRGNGGYPRCRGRQTGEGSAHF